MSLYANVILNNPSPDIDRIFDYEIPFELLDSVVPGVRVRVPFGNRNNYTEGYCLNIKDCTDVPESKIKLIAAVLDKEPLLSPEMIKLSYWMKERYFTALSQCFKVMLPAGVNNKNQEKAVFLNTDINTANMLLKEMEGKAGKKSQALILRYIIENGEEGVSKVLKSTGTSQSPINTLEKQGIIRLDYRRIRHDFENTALESDYERPVLNQGQRLAVDTVLNSDNKKPFLLFGITGSGKTEVYLNIIEKMISEGKQAVVLVPEISLTPLIVGRFKKRFGNKVGVTHSRMSAGERNEIWHLAKEGKLSVVVGARSAVFMPFKNLGVIIIDEEHESSYRSDSSPRYSAVEVAEERCRISGAKLVLGSATPSVESFYKAENKEYILLRLSTRAGGGRLPKTEIVDMRRELEEGNRTVFSRRLYYSIKEKLAKKEQIMLFLNRRGYSTFVSCRKCGYVMTCTNCSVAYKYHYNGNFLMCHYCGKKINVPKICPQCGSKYIKYFGTGTQKIEEEVKRYFPSARVLRMDFDTVSKKGSHREILNSFAKGEADILIGTQMIAKGHDFENVSLVGIMAADVSLNTGDYRGSEITFELITQAAGRAGRGEKTGEVIIQTYQPDNFAVKCAANQNYEEFYKKELAVRKTMLYPPFAAVFTIVFTGGDENKVSERISVFAGILKKRRKLYEKSKIDIIGPAEAAVYKVKNQYRMAVVIKCADESVLRSFTEECLKFYKEENKTSSVMVNLYLSAQNIF